ncbi:MAG: amidohydrolase family protein [Alphaproteobacteria bacterium]|nr:amidohydrolase family protein [Alphaproteobacteria bacterium]
MIVDTHCHSWRRGDGFPVRIRTRVAALNADFPFPPAGFAQAGVDKAVLVSAAQSPDETEALFALADANPITVLAVIGFLDPFASDFATRLAAWRRRPVFRGLRLPLVVFDDPAWIETPPVLKALDALNDAGLIAEILVEAQHLDAVHRVLTARPNLAAIIDHAANPPARRGPDFDAWREKIALIARDTDAICKFGDLRNGGAAPPADDVAVEIVGHVARHFGNRRLIAGSNWPVAGVDGDPYGAAFVRLRSFARATGLEEPALFADNALRFFGRTT